MSSLNLWEASYFRVFVVADNTICSSLSDD